jgi:uncharacterized membrane protein YcaP (DUF421 family)
VTFGARRAVHGPTAAGWDSGPMQGWHHALLGDWPSAEHAAVKMLALFVTTVVALRLTERRPLSQLTLVDWVTGVTVGSVIGRTATATDAPWLSGSAALVTLLLAHLALTRLPFLRALHRAAEPPVRVLVRDGRVESATLRRCGLARADLDATLRLHGHPPVEEVHLALFEAGGGVSVLPAPRPPVG